MDSFLAGSGTGTNFDISTELVRFLMEEPFYAHILRSLSKEECEEIPTAGVVADKKNLRFFLRYNPGWMASLGPAQVQGLLIHEVLHLVYQHTTSRKYQPHDVHNWAADLAINSQIPEYKLPAGGLIPGKPFPPLPQEILCKSPPEALAVRARLSDKIAKFPTHKSTEWYFVELMNDPQTVSDIQNQAEKNAQRIKPSDLRVDADGNLVDKDGNPVSIVPGPTDDHDGWGDDDDMKEAEEIMDQKVRDALAAAIRRADQMNRWGSVPHELRTELRELVSVEVPWQQLLKRFSGFVRSIKRDTSWTRLNRRIPGGTAGSKRGVEARIAIYVDQSGSVSDDALSLLFGELQQLAKNTRFMLFPFDTAVGKGIEVKSRRNIDFIRTRCGGTDFQAACSHGDDLCTRGEIHGYLIMTDGECYKPKPSRFKRGWIVIPGHTLNFQEDPNEVLIQMKS